VQRNWGQKRLNARGSTFYIIVEALEPVARRAKLGDTKMQEILPKNEEKCFVCTAVGKALTFKAEETETC
jgi:hypothetical protein